MANTSKPRRDITHESLTFPPHGKTSRGSKGIFVIFFAVMIAIVVFALYVTFNTDSREETINVFNTETAELYNTAAANSTSTAAAATEFAATTVATDPALVGTEPAADIP